MQKIIKYIFIIIPIFLGGCKKFVDLKPEDGYTDEQVFSNAATIRQTLNGVYSALASEKLYGAGLTMEAVDIVSKQYDNGAIQTGIWKEIADNYSSQGPVGSTFDAIWTAAYAHILMTNDFIAQLDKIKGNGVLIDAQFSQLKGEALALRAFMHFDVLRLFGPQYLGNDDELAIPYYTKGDGIVQPVLKFGEAITKILNDLAAAEILLINDPIITAGVVTSGTADFYTGFRNRRMNYYAVKAIQARTYLYVGKKEEAHTAALASIEKADQIFPWTPFDEVIGNVNPDRIFSSEIIMGIQNPSLYSLYNRLFSSGLQKNNVLTPSDDQLATAFEGNENDYRFRSSWLMGGYGFRTLFKYADIADNAKSWRFFQPLIRKSEMYYILAETDPDQAQAVHYLNQVRFNRGLPDLSDDAQLADYGGEIEKEYNREFYAEGQLFFYFKRINPWWRWDIPSYRIPLPISETQLR